MRRAWTTPEKRAVIGHLGRFISSEVYPGKDACEECIRKSNGVLSGRKWTGVKFFVKNEIVKRKRMIEKQKQT